jgi:hypothetical protein
MYGLRSCRGDAIYPRGTSIASAGRGAGKIIGAMHELPPGCSGLGLSLSEGLTPAGPRAEYVVDLVQLVGLSLWRGNGGLGRSPAGSWTPETWRRR